MEQLYDNPNVTSSRQWGGFISFDWITYVAAVIDSQDRDFNEIAAYLDRL
jgi:hypothetical protein